MYRLFLSRPLVVCRKTQPMFVTNCIEWIAPDHLLTPRTAAQRNETEAHARELVCMLARKVVHDVDSVCLHDIRTNSQTLYTRLLGAPEVYSHLYMQTSLLKPLNAPCPPFDDLDLTDSIRVDEQTRLDQMKRI
jgi:hypothetical protein